MRGYRELYMGKLLFSSSRLLSLLLFALIRYYFDDTKLQCWSKPICYSPCFLYLAIFEMEGMDPHSFKFLMSSGNATKFLIMCSFYNPKDSNFTIFRYAIY